MTKLDFLALCLSSYTASHLPTCTCSRTYHNFGNKIPSCLCVESFYKVLSNTLIPLKAKISQLKTFSSIVKNNCDFCVYPNPNPNPNPLYRDRLCHHFWFHFLDSTNRFMIVEQKWNVNFYWPLATVPLKKIKFWFCHIQVKESFLLWLSPTGVKYKWQIPVSYSSQATSSNYLVCRAVKHGRRACC